MVCGMWYVICGMWYFVYVAYKVGIDSDKDDQNDRVLVFAGVSMDYLQH
jgi:hypothetical protein